MEESELLELHKIPGLSANVTVDLWIHDPKTASSSPCGVSGLLFDDSSDLWFSILENHCPLESPGSDFSK